MKFKVCLGTGLAMMLGVGISAALAQVTLTGTNGTLTCNSHNGVQVSSSGAITINVGNCDLGDGSGGNGDNGNGGVTPAVVQSTTVRTLSAGSTASFNLRLNSAPEANVTLSLNNNNSGVASISPSSLIFTPNNATIAQTVSISGLVAGSTSVSGTTASADDNFDGLDMAGVNIAVTSTGGGGPTGDDPGLGKKWQTTYQGQDVFVVDRSAYSNRTYFPGCLSQNWSALGLSHNRSLNPFDGTVRTGCRGIGSLRAGETYAQRIPFATGTRAFTIKLARAEAGESGIQPYEFAVSSTPGDLNPASARCAMQNSSEGTISLMARSQWLKLSSMLRPAYCPLTENTVYFLNFRPTPGTEGATKCGNGTYDCRVQVITDIPTEYFQDVRAQSDSY